MKPGTVSVILATYNAPAALRASLESFAQQTDRGFEVVVADDGSTAETSELLAALAPWLPFPLRRAWQEDSGFRLARARNLAVARARGDYAVFVDGDCLVLPDFIAWHRRLAQPGHFVSGKRSWLRAGTSACWLARPRGHRRWRWRWFARALANRCTRPLEFVPFPDGRWRHRAAGEWRGAQGCNLGVWCRDLDRVNGFDNRYVGHGLEDSDLAVRLIRAGVRRKLGGHASPVLHLWHPRRAGAADSPNRRLFEAVLAGAAARAPDGLAEVGMVENENDAAIRPAVHGAHPGGRLPDPVPAGRRRVGVPRLARISRTPPV